MRRFAFRSESPHKPGNRCAPRLAVSRINTELKTFQNTSLLLLTPTFPTPNSKNSILDISAPISLKPLDGVV